MCLSSSAGLASQRPPCENVDAVKYDRTVVAYHGCDAALARQVLAGKRELKPSKNDYDWLGEGIYFWEYGADRALQFAHDQVQRGRVRNPTYLGALIQLGKCFDLMDTRFTADLREAFPLWRDRLIADGRTLPVNGGGPDKLLRRLDCAFLNWYLERIAQKDEPYDSVRCGFVEGKPVFEGSGIMEQSHVQLAIRNPSCIVGLFRPNMDK